MVLIAKETFLAENPGKAMGPYIFSVCAGSLGHDWDITLCHKLDLKVQGDINGGECLVVGSIQVCYVTHPGFSA